MKNLFTLIKVDPDDPSPEEGAGYELGWRNVYEELSGDMDTRRTRYHAYAEHGVRRLLGFSHVRAHSKKGSTHARHTRQMRLL